MAVSKPKVWWPLTIDATNKYVDFTGGAGLSATIATGVYYSISSLMDAVKAALIAAEADTWNYSISATGKITITNGTTPFILNWHTGAHAATSARYILGWTDADTAGASSTTAPNQHQHGWYSDRGVSFDPGSEFESSSTVTRSENGNIEAIDNGEQTSRRLSFPLLPNYLVKIAYEGASASFDGADHTNAAMERWWRDGRARFRYWNAATTSHADEGLATLSAGAIAAGIQDYALDPDTIKSLKPVRIAPSTPKFNISLGLWLFS